MHDRVLKCFVQFFRRRSLQDSHHGLRAFLRTCKGRTESDEEMKEALDLFYADEYWNVTQLSLNACALELLQVLAAETLQCTVYVAEDTKGDPDRLRGSCACSHHLFATGWPRTQTSASMRTASTSANST